MSHGVDGRTPTADMDTDLAGRSRNNAGPLDTEPGVDPGATAGGAVRGRELADAVSMEASAVSHQLRQLRYLGLVVVSAAASR